MNTRGRTLEGDAETPSYDICRSADLKNLIGPTKKSDFHSFFKCLGDLNGNLKKFEFKFKPGLDWDRTETVWLSRGCP